MCVCVCGGGSDWEGGPVRERRYTYKSEKDKFENLYIFTLNVYSLRVEYKHFKNEDFQDFFLHHHLGFVYNTSELSSVQ